MRLVERLSTDLYDDQENYVGHASTFVYVPSSLWERVRGEWERARYWTHTTLSDGITHDGLLYRAKTLQEARDEHASRAWNYRVHLLGEDWR